MANPYNDNSDERADVNDISDLISASSFNNVRETERFLKWGTEHAVQTSAVYGAGSFDLLRSGHDLDKGYLKSAFPQLFVSSLDSNPAQAFQDHCLTNRGEHKHIVVDSSASLGQVNHVINSNTVIEGAVFDNVSGTYKELNIGGISDDTITVAGASNPYTLSNINTGDLLVYKINIGDIVFCDDGVTSAFGEVAGNITANGCNVNFFTTPPIGATVDCVLFKTNISFKRCTFYSKVQILNTYNTTFEDCLFVTDTANNKFGCIMADVPYFGNGGGGTGNFGLTFLPSVTKCIFRNEAGTTLPATPSGILANIALDRATLAFIHDNRFQALTALATGNFPISSNTSYQRLNGGMATDNIVRNYNATIANIRTNANRVVSLYQDRNVYNTSIW